MDHLFDDAFTRPVGMSGSSLPAIDLYQTSDAVVVKAALPGFKPDDVQISVTSDVLTLRGEFKQENEQNDTVYHLRERRHASFERSLTLPTSVQTDKARADFENGVLTIQLPKSEEVKPKSISIKAR
jgi:HSP20 family protein